jgi:CubicO group peptidase (beta-lactamase class C family)
MSICRSLGVNFLVVFGSCLFLATAAADSETADSTIVPDVRFAEIRSLIERRIADDIPSFGVSVIHKGEVLWEEAFGLADINTQIPATTDSLYSIASVSKSITATGVMLLAERGDLDLNDPIDEYLGADVITPLAVSAHSATVRDLLTMTAGFPMGYMGVYAPNPVPSRDELLRDHGGIQVFPPGRVFHYSNFSLGVAVPIVEKATGKSFDAVMNEILFDPAGMTSTFYSGSPATQGQLVTNYEPDGTPWPKHTSMPAGGGGSYSSLSDLRRYALAHLGHSESPGTEDTSGIISKAIRETMHNDISDESDGMFAVGWWVLDLGDGESLVVSDGHGAGMALVQLLPAEDLAVICVMNTRKTGPDGQGLTNKVGNLVFEAISPGFTAKYNNFWRQNAESNNGRYQPTPEMLGRWSGFVRAFDESLTGIELLVQPDGDIHVTLEDQYTVLLTETRFSNGVLEGWFPGELRVDVPNDRVHDIVGRLLFEEDQAQGYLNSNFDDAKGVYDLSSYVSLQREPDSD